MNTLPAEIVAKIFSETDLHTQLISTLVCKRFYTVVHSHVLPSHTELKLQGVWFKNQVTSVIEPKDHNFMTFYINKEFSNLLRSFNLSKLFLTRGGPIYDFTAYNYTCSIQNTSLSHNLDSIWHRCNKHQVNVVGDCSECFIEEQQMSKIRSAQLLFFLPHYTNLSTLHLGDEFLAHERAYRLIESVCGSLRNLYLSPSRSEVTCEFGLDIDNQYYLWRAVGRCEGLKKLYVDFRMFPYDMDKLFNIFEPLSQLTKLEAFSVVSSRRGNVFELLPHLHSNVLTHLHLLGTYFGSYSSTRQLSDIQLPISPSVTHLMLGEGYDTSVQAIHKLAMELPNVRHYATNYSIKDHFLAFILKLVEHHVSDHEEKIYLTLMNQSPLNFFVGSNEEEPCCTVHHPWEAMNDCHLGRTIESVFFNISCDAPIYFRYYNVRLTVIPTEMPSHLKIDRLNPISVEDYC